MPQATRNATSMAIGCNSTHCNPATADIVPPHLAAAERGQPRRMPLSSSALVGSLEVERPLPSMALEEKVDRVFMAKLPLEQLLAGERDVAVVHSEAWGCT